MYLKLLKFDKKCKKKYINDIYCTNKIMYNKNDLKF